MAIQKITPPPILDCSAMNQILHGFLKTVKFGASRGGKRQLKDPHVRNSESPKY
ncbi:uncharacterized protein G2W53_012798 [Senna tora]|uniref:Uncharacterized protein n=1 Tax=Senna tora TaxID=362788 RepID=A0A834WNW2_9FABA|nr:uncharacterized protein G2W53_012798 [Senna tora]